MKSSIEEGLGNGGFIYVKKYSFMGFFTVISCVGLFLIATSSETLINYARRNPSPDSVLRLRKKLLSESVTSAGGFRPTGCWSLSRYHMDVMLLD